MFPTVTGSHRPNPAVLGGPGWLALGACAVVAMAALMPWAGSGEHSVLGIEGDGVLTLAMALLGITVGLLGTPALGPVLVPHGVAIGLSAGLVVLGLLVTAAVGGNIAGVDGAHHGAGWALTLAGFAAWGVALAWDVVSDRLAH